MVKIQKPLPKHLGNKPKLDNPIKKKKDANKKGKTTENVKSIKEKLLDSTPIKEAKILKKPTKEIVKTNINNKKSKGGKELPATTSLNGTNKEKKNKNKDPELTNKSGGKSILLPNAPNKNEVTGPKNKNKEQLTKNKNNLLTGQENKQKQGSAPKAQPKVGLTKPSLVPQVKILNNGKAEQNNLPKKVNKNKKNQEVTELNGENKKKQKPTPVVASKTKVAVKPLKAKTDEKINTTEENTESKVKKQIKPKLIKKKAPLQQKKLAKIAFKKAQLAAKAKHAKKIKPTTTRFDPIPYDEDNFNAIVHIDNIKKVADTLKPLVEKEVAAKKSTIFEDYRYILQIGYFKIPNCPKRMVKLHLKHSLVDKDDDVLLIVPDLIRGSKVDYEPTKHHWEDILRENGIEGITVMPMNQFRKEYRTFEQKRRLCATYEHIMADGRIVSHLVALLGMFTQKPRSTIHAVRLTNNKNIKQEIERALRKTAYRQLERGSQIAIPIGTHRFSSQEIAENVKFVVEQLKTVYPGGLGNIRNMVLKIGLIGTSALPLYMSMALPPDQTPTVTGPREQRMSKLKREANEVLAKFAMTKEGKMIKLSKKAVEKKRKLQEMKAVLKEDEKEAKKAKKAKKVKDNEESKQKKKKEVKELELPESEEEEEENEDDSSDEDEDENAQLGSSSDDNEMDEEGGESETEILENGLGSEATEDDDDQEDGVNERSDDGDDDEEDDDEDEEDDDDEEEDDDDESN